jgi:hypothetical protein
MRIRDGKNSDLGSEIEKKSDPGSGMEKIRVRDPGWKKFVSGIRYKHSGSATLLVVQDLDPKSLQSEILIRIPNLTYSDITMCYQPKMVNFFIYRMNLQETFVSVQVTNQN